MLWAERRMEEAAYRYQVEVQRRERIVVGANAFVVPPERDHAVPVHPRPTPEDVAERRAAVGRFRERRDAAAVAAAINHLRAECDRGACHNLIPALIDTVKAGVTLGEAVGVMREAFGAASRLRKDGLTTSIAINIDAGALKHLNLPDLMERMAAEAEVPAQSVSPGPQLTWQVPPEQRWGWRWGPGSSFLAS